MGMQWTLISLPYFEHLYTVRKGPLEKVGSKYGCVIEPVMSSRAMDRDEFSGMFEPIHRNDMMNIMISFTSDPVIISV